MTELISAAESAARLEALAASWHDVHANERAVFQPWMIRFCEALGVAAPDHPTDDYRFELPVKVVDRDGNETSNFIDCWKRDHVAVEAKVIEAGKRDDLLLRKAFGQVRTYVAHVPGTPPPYLMVVDVAKTIIVWERWSGSYGDFAAGRRIAIPSLHDRPEDIALLQDIFARPSVRDPRGRAQAVTKDIAGRLAFRRRSNHAGSIRSAWRVFSCGACFRVSPRMSGCSPSSCSATRCRRRRRRGIASN